MFEWPTDLTVRPINTYGGQGVTKTGFNQVDREAHAIIHMSDTEPYQSPEETDINKRPIAVEKATLEQKLDRMSRINFSRVNTVNHDAKAMHVGMVVKASLPYLITYFNQNM
jgi:hypothetical protein